MSSSAEVEELRRRIDANPADDEARAELAVRLARAGDREGAAEAFYLAACGARKLADEALYRERIRRCLEADPAYPLVFTGPPRPPAGEASAWARILVAHPESRVRGPIVRLLRDHGYVVEEAATAGSAKAAIRQAPADLVLTAPAIVDGDALAVATAARKARSTAAIVLLTCAVRGERIESASELAPLVDEHLDRPLSPDRLLDAVRAALWRHRHAAPVAPAGAGPSGRPATEARKPGALARTVLIAAAGYAVLFLLDSALESAREARQAQAGAQAAAAALPRTVPAEIDWDAERSLWVQLTGTHTSPDLRVTVTALEPKLVAARVYRSRRLAPSPRTASAEEVAAAIAVVAPDTLVSLEIHLEAGRDVEIDPQAVAASLKLRASDRAELAPSRVSPPSEMRFVRAAESGRPPRVRALTFIASFPRHALGTAGAYALSLTAGGRALVIFVPAPSRRG